VPARRVYTWFFDFVVSSFYLLTGSIATAGIQTSRCRTDAWGTSRLLTSRWITTVDSLIAVEDKKNRALRHPRIRNQTKNPALEKHQELIG
jgi:hypothetical protein